MIADTKGMDLELNFGQSGGKGGGLHIRDPSTSPLLPHAHETGSNAGRMASGESRLKVSGSLSRLMCACGVEENNAFNILME